MEIRSKKGASCRQLDAMIFCNNFARWLQTIVATWCDVLVSLDATIFCNNFARWLQTIVATWCDVLVFLGCYDFVTTLCQPSATRPIFRTNLHFRQFVKTVNYEFRLKFRSKCPKWTFVPKMGRVADGCFMLPKRRFWMAERTFGNRIFQLLFKGK